MQVVSVDLFRVPEESKAAFQDYSNTVQNLIKGSPGLVEAFSYAKTNGDSVYSYITIAVWESEETFESAGKVLWSAFQRQGLNPQATLDTLRVKRIRSEYTRSPF